ncbi:MAG: anthranilate phosphoribosyltransferase, partial [Pseudonocardiaceae bacterium]
VVDGAAVRRARVDPVALGVPVAHREDLRGGDAATNADAVRHLLAGEPGPVRDAVVLNAAAALAAHRGWAGDLVGELAAMTQRAARAVDSGAAAALLERWTRLTVELSANAHSPYGK